MKMKEIDVSETFRLEMFCMMSKLGETLAFLYIGRCQLILGVHYAF